MILKNNALQELYDTLTYGPITISPYVDSPIDRAFKECDEKLSESIAFAHIKDLENRCDNLERSNKALRDDNDKVSDKAIELAKKNEQLEKDIDIWKRSNDMLLSANLEATRKKRKAEEEVEDLKKDLDAKDKENSTLVSANADLSDRNAKLQRNFDRINHLWTGQIQENMELRSKIANLQREKKNYETIAKERADLVKERDEARQDRDAWQRIAKYAEKELDLAKRNSDGWKSRAMHAEKRYAELQKEKEEMEKSRKCYRQLHVGEGARHLWGMLQNVNDSQPFEFDVDCESMEDVIGMDLDDFLDAYKKWQKEKEQNETDRMRNWLADFCYERDCKGCPLESNEYKCGCGYSFKKTDESDTRIIPDEDIKRYYEKARGCGRYTLPTEGVNRAISKACEEFRKAVLDADNKITENLRKGCTLEATVEVDKDLLTKVCGVEHQLEYGDAVRVPWKNYDYMYIGPEGKHIRLFDPKTHTVVVVSVRDNLTYQGCKIILCDEDDIRKIWKDKK